MDMGGHDHGMGESDAGMSGASCKISMLWNWYTVDACFLSETWHVRNKAQYAGTLIGIFLIVMSVELVRRIGREYDRRLLSAYMAKLSSSSVNALNKNDGTLDIANVTPFTYTYKQQLVRSGIYGVQFTAAFLIMLFGMYFNGGVLFAIFLGGTCGHYAFARDATALQAAGPDSGCCC